MRGSLQRRRAVGRMAAAVLCAAAAAAAVLRFAGADGAPVAAAAASSEGWVEVVSMIDAAAPPLAAGCPQPAEAGLHAARCFEGRGDEAFAWVRALEAQRWPAAALLRIEASRLEEPLGSGGRVWVELLTPKAAAGISRTESRSAIATGRSGS